MSAAFAAGLATNASSRPSGDHAPPRRLKSRTRSGSATPLPSAGIALALWNGGDIETLIAVASQDGCTLASFWVTGGGTLSGYVVGAPGFVNAAILGRFPDSEIPTGTPMILLCGAE